MLDSFTYGFCNIFICFVNRPLTVRRTGCTCWSFGDVPSSVVEARTEEEGVCGVVKWMCLTLFPLVDVVVVAGKKESVESGVLVVVLRSCRRWK